MKLGCLLVLVLLAPSTAAAQKGVAGRYRFAAGDTLRYHVQVVDSSTLSTPQGLVPIATMVESTMRLTAESPTRVHAAFTAFEVRVQTPQGLLAPSGDKALNLPFTLTISDRGVVTVTTTPVFPPELTRLVDPSTEFDDYFLVLPATALALGGSWIDTVTRSTSSATGQKVSREAITSYSVAGDTTIRGQHCFVITVASRQTITAVGPGPSAKLTVTNHLSGTENGQFLFDPVRGRMMGRQRVGDFSGLLRIEGGPEPVEYPLARRYLSGLELLP